MKKTLAAVLCVAFLTTGAMARPMHDHHSSRHHGGHTTVQVINIGHGHSQHSSHRHRPAKHIVHHRRHHHSHDNINLLGNALIAFAIFAAAAQ